MVRSAVGTAWVSDGACVYFGRSPLVKQAPLSPIVELIQGVYRLHTAQARKILRGRIFADLEPTPMCLAAVKVAAKRVSFEPDHSPPTHLPHVDVTAWPRLEPPELPVSTGRQPPCGHADYLNLARNLAVNSAAAAVVVSDSASASARDNAYTSAPNPRYLRDRPIGALLVSREGVILAAARNAGSVSKALHAEVNLIQSWYRKTGKPLPTGSRLYVTLKCCRMCAAMIWHAAEDIRTVSVYYGEDDPGPNGRATALDRGTYDRALSARGDSELQEIELQFKVEAS